MALNFNIYYLNFSKTYEMAMMINNVLHTKYEKEKFISKENSKTSSGSFTASAPQKYLNSIKATMSSESKQTNFSSSKVIETLDVKTTKSILLQSVIDYCIIPEKLSDYKEGDLIKIDDVKLTLFDETSLRSFLILRRDALKGLRVEGIEVNNLVNSMLQDYTYVLCGSIENKDSPQIIIKIPLEMQPEFENKYSINDLLIGHVSIVGIYKGIVTEDNIVSNTFNYFQDESVKNRTNPEIAPKIFKSNEEVEIIESVTKETAGDFAFIDTIAIIQDIQVKNEIKPAKKESLIKRIWKRIKNRRRSNDEKV